MTQINPKEIAKYLKIVAPCVSNKGFPIPINGHIVSPEGGGYTMTENKGIKHSIDTQQDNIPTATITEKNIANFYYSPNLDEYSVRLVSDAVSSTLNSGEEYISFNILDLTDEYIFQLSTLYSIEVTQLLEIYKELRVIGSREFRMYMNNFLVFIEDNHEELKKLEELYELGIYS